MCLALCLCICLSACTFVYHDNRTFIWIMLLKISHVATDLNVCKNAGRRTDIALLIIYSESN